MVQRTSIPAHPTNYYVGRRDQIKYVVIHTGETNEGTTAAEGMGNWFATDHGAGGRSSAHRGADTDSICTYVADANTAFGAPGVNANGWHLEHAGRAGQTTGQWDDAASQLILANGALAAAEASQRLGIPARWLTDAELRAGSVKGFIAHAQASRVLGGTHWDPGPNFPADRYIALVHSHLDQEDDDMTPEQVAKLDEIWRRSDDTQRAAERAEYLATSNSKRLQATQAALRALATSLPASTAKAVTDALNADYDATITLTSKENR